MKAQIGGSHYDKPVEHVDVMVANNFSYLESQVMKYIWRHKDKNGAEDILKSVHYLLFILKHDYQVIDQWVIDSLLGKLKQAITEDNYDPK